MGFISGISEFSSASVNANFSNVNQIAPQPNSSASLSLGSTVSSSPVIERVSTADNQLNLNDAIEQEKSLSFVYQMLLAIARENNEHNSLDVEKGSFQKQHKFEIDTKLALDSQITQNSSNTSNLSVSANNQSSLSLNISAENSKQSDPLILNLDNTDFKFETNQKIKFDLNADGRLDQFNNLNSSNAFLAFDKNNNGIIDDGSEFFGDTRGSIDGFADLALYDSNKDNQIDANDQLFKNLVLVQFSPKGEQIISSLGSHNIKSLSLNYQNSNQSYAGNNLLTAKARFDFEDGRSGMLGDFLLSIS